MKVFSQDFKTHLGVFLVLLAANAGAFAAETPCPFDEAKGEFAGTPLEQARCLLRPVSEFGRLGEPLAKLPSPLEEIIGKPVMVGRAKLQAYLTARKIGDDAIGGSITNILRAKYFVIHDISAPNYLDKQFPTNINDASWSINNLERWKTNRAAHFFVNRLGDSVAPHPLTQPWRAMKFESRPPKEAKAGMFVHTELVQPRRSDPAGNKGNDGIAPLPGFTEPQLDRLALLYIVASVEHGQWMVPAFHATVDAGIPNGHDDPQNFDLALWAKHLGALIRSIETENDAAK